MKESKLEKYLSDQIKKLGGLCYKWVSPGVKGVPDRIVIFNERVYFIELKSKDGKLSMVQKECIRSLRSAGADVRVIGSEEQLLDFLEELESEI